MSEQVDAIIRKSKKWRDEFDALRAIALASGLDEEVKWGQPCYTLNGSNVFLIHGFKDYCALLFFKGTLMKDPQKVLIQQTANVQSARQIRFTSLKEILKHKSVLKKYIDEAVKVEKSGAKVELKKTSEFEMCEEFRIVLKSDPEIRKAFQLLTPGRQRAYLLFFSSAKQSSTREARIIKCIPSILKGKGLND